MRQDMTAEQVAMWSSAGAGLWGIVMLAFFVLAIRLSYAIERRSPALQNTSGIPRKAMMFHTVFNLNVARDPETQAMRRRMNLLLLVNVIGFVLMFVFVFWLRGR